MEHRTKVRFDRSMIKVLIAAENTSQDKEMVNSEKDNP